MLSLLDFGSILACQPSQQYNRGDVVSLERAHLTGLRRESDDVTSQLDCCYLVEAPKAFLCLELWLWGLPDVSFMQMLQVVEQRLPDWYLLELDRRALQELPTNKRKTTGKREPKADVREVLEKLANSCRVSGWASLMRCLSVRRQRYATL